MVKIMENPYFLMDDLGGKNEKNPIFGSNTHKEPKNQGLEVDVPGSFGGETMTICLRQSRLPQRSVSVALGGQ